MPVGDSTQKQLAIHPYLLHERQTNNKILSSIRIRGRLRSMQRRNGNFEAPIAKAAQELHQLRRVNRVITFGIRLLVGTAIIAYVLYRLGLPLFWK